MYEDIITIVNKQMNVYVEGEVLKAVLGVGVNVDKEELIKALQYDRDQYNKGYVDGAKALAEKLMNIQARADYLMPSEGFIRHLLKEMVGE